MSNKILVVETGGTFATSSIGNVRTLGHEGIEKTVYEYDRVTMRTQKYNLQFEKIRPIFTLSENLTIDLLNQLLDALYNIDCTKYCGVIITHGTDTLAYTANIVSMLFSSKGIPFVFVSSNHPLSLPPSNGVDNFAAAIDFIATVKVQGTYVIYKNYAGETEVHLASRVKQMNQVVDSYESFKNIDFGKIAESKFYYNTDSLNPTIEQINAAKNPRPVEKLKLTKTVMIIHPYVGLRHDFYNINKEVDAVIYGVYHSGTFFSLEDYPNHSINQLIERLGKYDIPLFISEVSSMSDQYESSTKLNKKHNVNIAYDISLENLYAKVTVAFDLFDNIDDIKNYVNNTNVFFEKVI